MKTQLYEKGLHYDGSTMLALCSLGVGTFLFLLNLVARNDSVIVCGFLYLLLAFIVNGFMLAYLVYLFIMRPARREHIAIKMLILLANIPIAALYAYLTLEIIL
jgi:hypothetical protein